MWKSNKVDKKQHISKLFNDSFTVLDNIQNAKIYNIKTRVFHEFIYLVLFSQ
jgi:hypothetical protein